MLSVMAMSVFQTEEVRLLVALCRELAKQGLDVGMSDARPALSVRLGYSDPRLWISVNVTDGFFEWCRDTGGCHVVTDPEGAARVIAHRLRRTAR